LSAQTKESTCDPEVPTYSVDFTGQPAGIYQSPLESRVGLCCGAQFPDRCVQFFIRLDENARGLKFDIIEGAIPSGSLFYQIDCGPVIKVGEPICLEGGKDYILTFCKPGNNPNAYSIESIPGALFPDTVRTQVNCPVEIAVSGLEASTLRWRDVNTSAAVFNRYLSCTAGCDRVIATPDEEAEQFIRYEVCGVVSAENCPLTFEVCDTVVLEILPTPQTTFRTDICEGFSYEWRGRVFTEAGLYTDTLVNARGCDSLVSLELKVNPARRGSLSATICPGETYEIAGQQFSEAGTYMVTLTDSIDCDSVVTLALDVLPGPTPAISGPDVICSGGTVELRVEGDFLSYQWANGASGKAIQVSAPGEYRVTVTSASGCTAVISKNVAQAPDLDASIGGGGTITCSAPEVTLEAQAYTGSVPSSIRLTWLDEQGLEVGSGNLLRVGQEGWYYLSVSDATGGCTAIDSLRVTQGGDVPSFTLSQPGILDCETPEVTLSVNYDTSQNFTIRWTGPGIISGNPNLPVSEPGWYFIDVTDNDNGCVSTDSLRVREDRQIPALNLTDEVQLECDPGTVTLEAQVQESGDFNYQWQTTEGNILGNSTNASITVDAGGWYRLTVSDRGNGCTSTDSVFVNPANIIRSAEVSSRASCSNDPGGVINVSQVQGGASPYTFSRNDGQQNSNGLFEGLSPGTYQLSVADTRGCLWDTTLTIEAIEIVSSMENVELCQGQIYSWNGQELSQAGTYTDTLTGISGCDSIATLNLQFSTSNVVVNRQERICPGESVEVGGRTFSESGVYTIELAGTVACDSIVQLTLEVVAVDTPSIEGPAVLCQGGTAQLNVDGNYAAFLWSTGDTLGQLTVSSPGDYLVTVTDGNGCTASTGYSLEETAVPQAAIVGDTLLTCLDPYLRLRADSSLMGIPLRWLNDKKEFIGSSFTQLATEPGWYYLEVSDASGTCVTTDSLQLSIGQNLPVISLDAAPQITCSSTEVTLSVNVTGDPAAYAVRWYGPGLEAGETSYTPLVNRSGRYRVIVTDTLTGCYASASIRVTENRQPPVVAVTGQTYLDCETGETTLRGSSPDMTVSYRWSSEDGVIDSPPGQAEITVSAIGWYDLLVTDAETGCTQTAQVFVGFPDGPREAAVRALPTCENAEEGKVIVDRIDGGKPPFTYVFNGGPLDSAGAYTRLSAGVYNLEIIDSEGCNLMTVHQIEELPVPQVVERVDICEGLSYEWKGTVYTQTGMYIDTLGAYNGCDSLSILDLRVNPSKQVNLQVGICEGETFDVAGQTFTEAGLYTFVVPDSVTCDSVVTLELEVFSVDTPLVRGPEAFCEGDSIQLQAGGDFTTFEWSNGKSGAEIYLMEGGLFSVTATDANGCIKTTQYEVTKNVTPAARVLGDSTVTCTQSLITLEASGYDPASGWQISWWNSDRQLIGSSDSLNVSEPGVYSLLLEVPETGCQATDQIEVSDGRTFPDLSVQGPTAIDCIEDAINLEATLQGESSNTTVVWSGPGIMAGINTLTPRINAPGRYRVEAVDEQSGCSVTNSVLVADEREPPPTVLADSTGLDCQTGEAQLTASSQGDLFMYRWFAIEGSLPVDPVTAEITVTEPGYYGVEVIDETNGCSALDSVRVLPSEAPSGAEIAAEPTCAGEEQGRLLINEVKGGTAPFVFSLNGRPYSDLTEIRNLQGGEYEFLIEDANGCLWDTLLVIPELDPLNIDLGVDLDMEQGDSIYLLPSVNISQSQIADIIWTPAQWLSCTDCLDPVASPEASTTYRLEIIDINGCSGEDEIAILVDDRTPVYIPDAFSPNGDGNNDRFTIFAGERVARIRELRIFTRWGEMVYFEENFPPNDPQFGWDGNFQGQAMNAAVFVYFTVVELANGKEVMVKGDFVLMR